MARVIRGAARVIRPSGAGASERATLTLMRDLARERAQLREGANKEIATLALDVASRLVGERVIADGALLERIVLRALERARADSAVRVMLHPSDRAVLEERIGARLPAEIVLVDDASQSRGGCLVRGTFVTVDARLETTLATLAAALGVERPT